MRRFLRYIALDLLILVLLLASMVGLWGFRSTNLQQDAPATIRIIQGKVTIVDADDDESTASSGIRALKVGERVRVEAGGDAIVFYANGAQSRLTGPAELSLEKSRHIVKKPPILKKARSSSSDKTSQPVESRFEITARVLQGDIITKGPASATPGSKFFISGPGFTVSAGASSFAVTVTKDAPVRVETGTGSVIVGLVSPQGSAFVPVVIPQLSERQGIAFAPIATSVATSDKFRSMEHRVGRVASSLLPSASLSTSEGIAFSERTRDSIRYYVGTSVDGSPLVEPTPITSVVPRTAAIASALVPQQLASTTITDELVNTTLQAAAPGSPTVHFLPGNIFQIDYGGASNVGTLSAVNGHVSIEGLAFNIAPPQIENTLKTQIAQAVLPAILSITTESGQATIGYDVQVAAPLSEYQDEVGAVPDELPHTSPYFDSIATPREFSTDWKVISGNVLFAVVFTLLVSNLKDTIRKFMASYIERIQRIFDPLLRKIRPAGKGQSSTGTVAKTFTLSPFTRAILLMFLFGAIYSFLAVGKGFFGQNGISLLITLSFTSGFLALYDPWVRVFAARRMKIPAKIGLKPKQAGIAVLSVTISRVFSVKPGILVGSPAGLSIEKNQMTAKQQTSLNIYSIAGLTLLGVLTWVFLYFLPLISVQEWASGFFRTAKGFVSGVQDWSLVVFAAVVQRIFFAMLPSSKSGGHDVMERNKLVWSIAFGFITFIFLHTQLNRTRPIQDLTPRMITTLIVMACLAAAIVIYQRTQQKKKVAVEGPEVEEITGDEPDAKE